MRRTLIALVAAMTLAAAVTTAPTRADARCWGCWGGAAFIGGIAAGALIANNAWAYGPYYGSYGYGGYGYGGGYGYAPAYYRPYYPSYSYYPYRPAYYAAAPYYYPRAYGGPSYYAYGPRFYARRYYARPYIAPRYYGVRRAYYARPYYARPYARPYARRFY